MRFMLGRLKKPSYKVSTIIAAIGMASLVSPFVHATTMVVAWNPIWYGPTNMIAVAAGAYHNLELRADGTVIGSDSNYGQPNAVPSGLSNVIAIAAGKAHSLALKADGTVTGWGWNSDGQATVPSNLSNVVAIAGGGYHSLALKADGTVVGWGRNAGYVAYAGQATPPTNLVDVVAISAGEYYARRCLVDMELA